MRRWKKRLVQLGSSWKSWIRRRLERSKKRPAQLERWKRSSVHRRLAQLGRWKTKLVQLAQSWKRHRSRILEQLEQKK